MYEHVYNMCRNVEDVMGIFSEELKILDRNTVKYMVDEMQETIDEQNIQIKTQQNKIKAQENEIDKLQDQIAFLQKQLKEK